MAISDERTVVEASLGRALRADGRPRQAARAFLRAADAADAGDSLENRRAAADCLVGAGAIEEGSALLRETVHKAGFTWPRQGVVGIAALVMQRAALRLSGLEARVLQPGPPAPERIARSLDVLWTTAFDVGVADPVPALYFQALHTRLALRHGDYWRVTRAAARWR